MAIQSEMRLHKNSVQLFSQDKNAKKLKINGSFCIKILVVYVGSTLVNHFSEKGTLLSFRRPWQATQASQDERPTENHNMEQRTMSAIKKKIDMSQQHHAWMGRLLFIVVRNSRETRTYK